MPRSGYYRTGMFYTDPKATTRRVVIKGIHTKGRYIPPATRTYVKRMINAGKESNFHDEQQSAQAVSTTVQIYNLTNSITQGDGKGERVGDQIDMRHLRISFDFATIGTGSDAPTTLNDIRVMIFKWREDDSVLAPRS